MLGRIQASHFPAVFGPGGDQPLDTAVVAAKFAALAAEIGAATGQPPASRGSGRRVPGHRGREHGQRHQKDLGAARLRRDPVRAGHVRRGRRPARLRGRRRAGHRNRPHPPARRGAVRLRDGPGRPHRHAGAGGGGAASEGGWGGGWAARRTRPGRGRPGGRRAGRTGRRGRGPGPRDPGAPGAPALRGHRHRAARPAGHRGGHDRRVRAGLPAAVLVPHAGEGDPRRGGVGRGGGRLRGWFPGNAAGRRDGGQPGRHRSDVRKRKVGGRAARPPAGPAPWRGRGRPGADRRRLRDHGGGSRAGEPG